MHDMVISLLLSYFLGNASTYKASTKYHVVVWVNRFSDTHS